MTDSLKYSSIAFKAKALFNAYIKLVEISRASKERTLLRIPSKPEALFYNNRLRILLIFFFIIFRFIYKALLFYSGLIRFNKILSNRRKNFLIRILIYI
jgi:hypothetical protein